MSRWCGKIFFPLIKYLFFFLFHNRAASISAWTNCFRILHISVNGLVISGIAYFPSIDCISTLEFTIKTFGPHYSRSFGTFDLVDVILTSTCIRIADHYSMAASGILDWKIVSLSISNRTYPYIFSCFWIVGTNFINPGRAVMHKQFRNSVSIDIHNLVTTALAFHVLLVAWHCRIVLRWRSHNRQRHSYTQNSRQ